MTEDELDKSHKSIDLSNSHISTSVPFERSKSDILHSSLYEDERLCDMCMKLRKKGVFRNRCLHQNHPSIKSSTLEKNKTISTRQQHRVTQLLFAASSGELDAVRKFVRSSDPHCVNYSDYDRRSALHIAAAEGHLDIVKYLADCGASINPQDRWQATPLQEAVRHGHKHIVEFLKKKGAHYNLNHLLQSLFVLVKKGGVKQVEQYLKAGFDRNATDTEGRTILHVACREGHLSLVQLLVEEYQMDVSKLDRFQRGPLNEARDYSHSEVLAYLLAKGAVDSEKYNLRQTLETLTDFRIESDDLELGEQIGEGGYAIVYRAKWKGLTVAVKCIKPNRLDDSVLEDFRKEIETLSTLRHPRVLLFLGTSINSRGHLLVVTEYMENGSLLSMFQKTSNPLTYRERLMYAHDIAVGIAYLHSVGIIHRDLKPGNIFIDESGHCKIGDFGLSVREKSCNSFRPDKNTADKSKEVTGETGSYRYMAPENFQHKQYNTKVDVYSYSLIIYEIFTWQKPFGNEDPVKIAREASFRKLRPPLSRTSHLAPVVDLIRRCWDDDPNKRPDFAEIERFLADLLTKESKSLNCCAIL